MAVNIGCQDLVDVMYRNGFRNLVRGIQAQNLARISLHDVIEREWKRFIAAELPEKEKEQISTFIQCLKAKNVKRMFLCSKGQLLCCGHENCEALFSRLMKLVNITVCQMAETTEGEMTQKEAEIIYTRLGVPVSYSDSYFCHYWDLSKRFIDEYIDDDIDLRGGLDVKSLINLMKCCRLFEFQDSGKIYDEVCGDRDEMVYAPDLNISDEQLKKILGHLEKLLGNFSGSFVSCADAITDIRKLKSDLAVNYEKIEYKLLVKNVLEIIDSALRSDKNKMDFYGIESSSDRWLASKETISVWLLQVNELLCELDQDEVSELEEENENLRKELQKARYQLESKCKEFRKEFKRLEAEKEDMRRSQEALKERLEQCGELTATRYRGDNLQSVLKKLEWFETENRNLKETVKRLEREKDDYKRKVRKLSGQSASNLEETVAGFNVLHERELSQGRRITVLQGDIVKITAEAIVHPTNSTFSTRGAVGSALETVGGEPFLSHVKELQQRHGTLEVAKAALCKGQNFPAKYVIHVHSPGWQHENAKQTLHTATKNVLTLADEYKIRSIAIPSISSGHAGFPKLTAAETILGAINSYFLSKAQSSLKQVYFVLFDAESVTAYITELRRLSV